MTRTAAQITHLLSSKLLCETLRSNLQRIRIAITVQLCGEKRKPIELFRGIHQCSTSRNRNLSFECANFLLTQLQLLLQAADTRYKLLCSNLFVTNTQTETNRAYGDQYKNTRAKIKVLPCTSFAQLPSTAKIIL